MERLHATLPEAVTTSRRLDETPRAARVARLAEAPLILSWNRDDWMGWQREGSFFSEWQGVPIAKQPSRCVWRKAPRALRDALLHNATVVLFSHIRHQNTHHETWCDEPHDLAPVEGILAEARISSAWLVKHLI